MRNCLKAVALLGFSAGLVLGLGDPSESQTVDLVGIPWELARVDNSRVIFGAALVAWAVLGFFSASRGRVVLSASMLFALALGFAAIQLAGPFWFELSTVMASLSVTTVCLLSAPLLLARPPKIR